MNSEQSLFYQKLEPSKIPQFIIRFASELLFVVGQPEATAQYCVNKIFFLPYSRNFLPIINAMFTDCQKGKAHDHQLNYNYGDVFYS